MPSQLIRFESVTIDASTRTPIRATVDCQILELHNADLVNDCTLYDAETGGGSWPVQAGTKEAFERHPSYGGQWRNGDIVVWATAAAGTGPIRVKQLL
jgi:hypothetical protein